MPRGQSYAGWGLILSTCYTKRGLHLASPISSSTCFCMLLHGQRPWEKWECCLSVVTSLVGERPWAGFPGGLLGEHLEGDTWRARLEEDTWRTRLEGTPGGRCLEGTPGGRRLEGMPGGRCLEDTPGGHAWRKTPGGHSWRARLEDTLGGHTWRKMPGGHAWRKTPGGRRLEGTPGGCTWKETSEGDLLFPKHSPALPRGPGLLSGVTSTGESQPCLPIDHRPPPRARPGPTSFPKPADPPPARSTGQSPENTAAIPLVWASNSNTETT